MLSTEPPFPKWLELLDKSKLVIQAILNYSFTCNIFGKKNFKEIIVLEETYFQEAATNKETNRTNYDTTFFIRCEIQTNHRCQVRFSQFYRKVRRQQRYHGGCLYTIVDQLICQDKKSRKM